jgi:hypothetical protein
VKSRVGTRRLRAGTCRLGQIIGLGTIGRRLPGGRRWARWLGMGTGGLGLLTCEVACGNALVVGGNALVEGVNVSVRASYWP